MNINTLRKICVTIGLTLLVVIVTASAADGKETSGTTAGPVFAVFAPFMGPLAILALIFPGVFGGVLVLFKQWRAFFTVVTAYTVIMLLHWWFAASLVQSWWGTQSALWLTLTFVTLAGGVWAWRRNLSMYEPGQVVLLAPVKTELIVLGALNVLCLVGIVFYFLFPPAVLDNNWAILFILTGGLLAGILYKVYRTLLNRASPKARVDLPTEGIILSVSLVGSILFLTWNASPWNAAPPRNKESEVIARAGGNVFAGPTHLIAQFLGGQALLPTGGPLGTAAHIVVAAKVTELDVYGLKLVARQVDQWETSLAPGGMTVSSMCVDGDTLYLGWALQDPFDQTRGNGAIFCLNRHTHEPVWEKPFDADGQMRPVFSAPTVANGLLYVGEGFHYNPDCKMFCLDARTGQKRWEFPTKSQVESGPCVAQGKVYFGAGNDGVYCVDALTGKEYWRYGQAPGQAPIFRVGASAAVANDRVYVGSGVDREHPDQCEMAVVCLHAQPQADKAKQQIWKVTTNLPCWAAPVVAGDQVFFALGNGDLLQDAAEPAGLLLCLDARSGKELWRYEAKNGILAHPAVDAHRVFFADRNGQVVCVGRFDGKLRWNRSMDSPILSSPVLDQGDLTGRSYNVFAMSSKGRVTCFDSETGEIHWDYSQLENRDAFLTATPGLVVTPSASGTKRQLYFGVTLNWQSAKTPMVVAVEDVLGNR